MKTINLFITAALSTLLLSSTMDAQNIQCKDGKCFIDISKFTKSKSTTPKPKNAFKSVKSITTNNEKTIETIVLDHSKYIMNDIEKEEYYNNQYVIVLENNTEEKLYCDRAKRLQFYPELNEYICV